MRTSVARFTTECCQCGGKIRPGERMRRVADQGSWLAPRWAHADCPEPQDGAG